MMEKTTLNDSTIVPGMGVPLLGILSPLLHLSVCLQGEVEFIREPRTSYLNMRSQMQHPDFERTFIENMTDLCWVLNLFCKKKIQSFRTLFEGHQDSSLASKDNIGDGKYYLGDDTNKCVRGPLFRFCSWVGGEKGKEKYFGCAKCHKDQMVFYLTIAFPLKLLTPLSLKLLDCTW